MKEIKATIQPHMLSKVVQVLHELPHFPGMTVFKCQGQGRGRGSGGSFVQTEDAIDFHAKERIEIICSDEAVDTIVGAIAANAQTGNPGDGIITISNIAFVMRLRTGETGTEAV
ncbi:MAG: P-II family nitrogen regulator [Candidatus Zixiibacteriota bacterium]